MKLEILQENLNTALTQLHRIIPNKPQLPILSSILIDVSKSNITLSATDLYVGIKTTISGKIIETGKLAIPGKIFYSSINSLNPGKLTLSLKENTLTINSQNNKTTIQCLDATDFPDFPVMNGETHSLSTVSLENIQKMVGFSTSIDPTRPVLTSLLFQFDQDGLLVVGTDGFRLSTLKLPAEKMDSNVQFLVPAKAINEVTKITSTQDVEVVSLKISEELKQLVMEIGSTQLFVRLIEGEYPPFNKIIPTQYLFEAELDGAEFENQLKRAQIFARESSNIIRLKFSKNELLITAVSSSYGKHEGKMNIEVNDGEEGEIAFNSKYLLDFMSTLKPEKIKFLMNESLTPAMMRPDNQENYQYVVMPFRVNE
ncbi:MAG: DNA polymerase III subunit beta [Candidatus Pacebacteria bacterium]|jgi:DNA polymerase III subunit beta|nr:DNA polymerase III subunit beta [Candidatus Paceibacterota bacterium]MBT3512124.1 DNA polymerase III subunit beta [Candidatus Paceibacterota bacterium]MBT4005414.1 DNA polymerase III subunit beta [Candidatus Paceibacterota bacterium]MBT4359123.1 DNA polymerase III subunit beta [Candidatus Paceibacterota bacterium]MBT4680960.1 DNA polymerase III subunit beta [Candidatus Paceibacterota bacterium]